MPPVFQVFSGPTCLLPGNIAVPPGPDLSEAFHPPPDVESSEPHVIGRERRFGAGFQIGPDLSAQDRRVQAFLARRSDVAMPLHLAGGASTYVDRGLSLTGAGRANSGGNSRITKQFGLGETLSDFILQNPNKTFYLGIHPSGRARQPVFVADTNGSRNFHIKVQTYGPGQQPVFFMRDPSQRDDWVPLRVVSWNFPRDDIEKRDNNLFNSLTSLTHSIMSGDENPQLHPDLPRDTYGARVSLLYKLYRMHLKAGKVSFFHEIMRLSEIREGRYVHDVLEGSGSPNKEYLLFFATRVAATMGVRKFCVILDSLGTISADTNTDVAIRPDEGTWRFLFDQIAPGVFIISSRNIVTSCWEEVLIRYGAGLDVQSILQGDYFVFDAGRESPLVLRRKEDADPMVRRQVGYLKILIARASEYKKLRNQVRSSRGIEDYLEGLILFFIDSVEYMQFLSHVPCKDPHQPENRFLTAIEEIYKVHFVLFTRQVSVATELGGIGMFNLRYALRVYVAEKVKRYLESFTPSQTGLPRETFLNECSDFLFDLMRTLINSEALRREMRNFPFREFTELAKSCGSLTVPQLSTLPRQEFVSRARQLSRDLLYPTSTRQGEPEN